MTKRKFRITRYGEEGHHYYETSVKTWIGWLSFSVFFKTDIVHVISDSSDEKALAYERIYQYCDIQGYNRKDILISEINEPCEKKWVFFHRILSEKAN
jgi:hypothetical protein